MLGVRFEDFGVLGGATTGGSGVGAQVARSAGRGATVGVRFGETTVHGRLAAEVVHPIGAEVVASFTDGLAAGSAALTRHRSGGGEAWYVATMPDPAGLDAIVGGVVAASGVLPVAPDLPAGVEAARRGDLVTLINHGDEAVWIEFDGTDAETGAAVGLRELASQGVIFAMAPALAEQPARLAAAR